MYNYSNCLGHAIWNPIHRSTAIRAAFLYIHRRQVVTVLALAAQFSWVWLTATPESDISASSCSRRVTRNLY